MENNSFKKTFICLFLYILCLHAMAIFFFARGFLLTRTELSAFSHCSDVEQSPCIRPSEEPGVSNEQNSVNFEERKEQKSRVLNDSSSGFKQICWTKPAVERVVIIVLDALRFDFVAPSSLFKGSGMLSKFSSRGQAMDEQIASASDVGFRRRVICTDFQGHC